MIFDMLFIIFFFRISKKLCIFLDHSSNSTGSAYDIMVILYFPPEVGYVKYSQYLQNIIKTPEQSIDIDGKTVVFNVSAFYTEMK